MFIVHESNNKSTPEWMSGRTKKTTNSRTQPTPTDIIKQEKEVQTVNTKSPVIKQTDKIAAALTESLDPESEEEKEEEEEEEEEKKERKRDISKDSSSTKHHSNPSNPVVPTTEPKATPQPLHALLHDDNTDFQPGETEKKGTLICHGKKVESEVIYWRKVQGDRHYESPITPHHE